MTMYLAYHLLLVPNLYVFVNVERNAVRTCNLNLLVS